MNKYSYIIRRGLGRAIAWPNLTPNQKVCNIATIKQIRSIDVKNKTKIKYSIQNEKRKKYIKTGKK